MTNTVPRALMTVATRCLGAHHRDWAWAMEAEFDAACADGRSLSFAIGCLTAAWREMLTHEEGRFAIANHLLAVGLVVPFAGALLSGALLGFPYVAYLGDGGVGSPFGGGVPRSLLNEGTSAAAPALSLLVLLLGAAHLLMAWLMLERDWGRVAATARFCAAVTVTLAMLSAFLVVYDPPLLWLVGGLGMEALAISVVMRWSDEIGDAEVLSASG